MSTGDRLILVGNLLGSFAMTLISVGGILRTKELPDKPLFAPNDSIKPTVDVQPSNQQQPYWER